MANQTNWDSGYYHVSTDKIVKMLPSSKYKCHTVKVPKLQIPDCLTNPRPDQILNMYAITRPDIVIFDEPNGAKHALLERAIEIADSGNFYYP